MIPTMAVMMVAEFGEMRVVEDKDKPAQAKMNARLADRENRVLVP